MLLTSSGSSFTNRPSGSIYLSDLGARLQRTASDGSSQYQHCHLAPHTHD